ncbi:MAG: hypothetical protein IPM76_27760 [Chloroflexi bacterium]|nr:hypothetical protein [Chloroflexota bacterium]
MSPTDWRTCCSHSRNLRSQKFPATAGWLEKADDAAVYQINDHQAIISTTDFFPPVVDDPYDFGAIAAANAMSDIYAMGGQVLFAINLVAFPTIWSARCCARCCAAARKKWPKRAA